MIDLLRSRPGITIGELAAALGRSERTVYRWLNEISSDLQMPLQYENGGYHLLERYVHGHINLTAHELLALHLSLKSSPFIKGSPIKKHAESAWWKIRSAVCSGSVELMSELMPRHAVDITDITSEIDPSVIEVLETAVNKHHRIEATYRSQKSNAVKDYLLDPYALVFRRHSWYLLAYSHEHRKVVQFKLLRFKEATDTRVTFSVPSDFSSEDFFYLSWEAWTGENPVLVRIWFAPEVAEMIAESRRHPTQIVRPQPDGGVIYEVTVSAVEEIAHWVMSYGRHAKVLEPDNLRELICDHISGMVAAYG